MKKSVLIFTILVLGTLIVSACAPIQTVMSTPSAYPYPSTEGQKIVTLEDQGKTITLVTGESFLLELGDAYTWKINLSDQSVVSPAKDLVVTPGVQGVYEALKAGTATLAATGDPLCRQSKPACGMPSIQFEITIVVK